MSNDSPPVHTNFLARFYPELDAGGYTSVDGTVEFYGRINSLLHADMTVLDFGAGRAAWFEDDVCSYRRSLRLMKGKVREVIGCDVDQAVLSNRSIDRALVLTPGREVPLESMSVDLIVCDYVFEHVENRDWLAGEFDRILKPGGWICARTPSKWSYVAMASRLVPNRRHSRVLRYAQPTRKEVDVFPTCYRINTRSDISRAFPGTVFKNCSYYFAGEPAYHFQKSLLFLILRETARVLPALFHANLFIFLQKKVT